MNYKTITLDNGKEINFKLNSKYSVELEKKTGKGIFEVLQSASITTIITILVYMRRWEVPNFSQEDACNLYDELVDNGYAMEDILKKIVYPTLVVSGFLKQEELDNILDETENKRNRVQE